MKKMNIYNVKKNEEVNEIIRKFENSKYYGYMFYIKYDGEKFDSFDENPDLRSVKGEFKKLLEINGIKIYKGVQQAGRTDAGVSSLCNILYINSIQNIEFSSIKVKKMEGIEIVGIKKTLPQLEFPEMIEKRYYIYEYPKEKIKNNENIIFEKCKALSGKKDFKEFTSKKGEKLKNHIREIYVKYNDGKLYFEGDGFLPQQVRIMSNMILNNRKSALDGKYLTLEKVELSDQLKNYIFKKVENIKIDKVKKIEKNELFYVFYVNKKDKGELIGKKGKNIKQLKKEYGNIVVKEV